MGPFKEERRKGGKSLVSDFIRRICTVLTTRVDNRLAAGNLQVGAWEPRLRACANTLSKFKMIADKPSGVTGFAAMMHHKVDLGINEPAG